MKKDLYLDTTRTIYDYEIDDFCELNDIKYPAMGSSDYYGIMSRVREEEISDFFRLADKGKWGNKYCLIVGTLDTWRGKLELNPTLMYGLSTAIAECVKDYDGYQISINDNTIKIVAGTNTFSISILSSEGEKAYKKYIDEMYKDFPQLVTFIDNPQYYIEVDKMF